MLDIHILAGLATLIVLELVLGIDNLVFIAILANKLPPHQRDRARVTGLVMAMAMRLGLLAVMSHIAALTDPVVGIAGRGFSPRDIILILGGVFLVYKATREIHEKLEGHHASQTGERRVPTLTATLVQIVALDAIFSLDSIITAVGMVEDLWVMMAAVVISMGIMVAASKPLTSFVSKRPTVIILCLSFLLLIGCSLIADGFGFHVPKTYLYAAIGFSLLIESLNQVGGLKHRRKIMDKPIRERTADAILRLMVPTHEHDHKDDLAPPPPIEAGGLHDDETDMIKGVISLGSLTARSIMTLRPDIVWVDANRCGPDLIDELLASGRTRVLLCDGALDDVIGVVEVRDAFRLSHSGSELDLRPLARTPLYVQEQMVVIDLVGVHAPRCLELAGVHRDVDLRRLEAALAWPAQRGRKSQSQPHPGPRRPHVDPGQRLGRLGRVRLGPEDHVGQQHGHIDLRARTGREVEPPEVDDPLRLTPAPVRHRPSSRTRPRRR
jgi:predicted tellurium resistance membrane protein TerC